MTINVRSVGWLFLGAIVLAFLLFVWPSMWTYAVLSGGNGQALVRVNKINGRTNMVANTFPAPPPGGAK